MEMRGIEVQGQQYYIKEPPDGETEHCVSGSCSACDSKWRDDTMNDWKEEVCCGERGKEPNANNGSCKDPILSDPGKIGVGYSKITAFPGCSTTPAGQGEGSYCKPPPSSSSSPPPSSSSGEPSSSSRAGPSSSSEQQEDAECYASDLEANAALSGMNWGCRLEGKDPGFYLDRYNCIAGECVELSSSSSGEASSSSGSGDGQCLASKPFLQKEADIYDDWVYMGKETYGSKVVKQSSLKPGTKFFDVLGRTYNKMVAKLKYYVFKDAVQIETNVIAFEFEVWARIVKDSEGNDIQVFVKEDKGRGLRRDSTFYHNGNWEVMETDEVAKTIKSKTSLGVKIVSLHDRQWRVASKTMTDKNDDTLASQLYVWKNSRLVKTIFNGVERNFVYGKTLQDTVKVIPADNGIGFHSGYNNTVGRIPDENDPEYSSFAMSPYSVYGMKPIKPMLFKYNEVGTTLNDIPIPGYYNPPFRRGLDINSIYPNGYSRGYSILYPHLTSECHDNGCGQFYVTYEAKTIGDSIILYQSHLAYDTEHAIWRRYCRTQEQIKLTYYHEAQHIYNARNRVKWYARSYMPMPTQLFSTMNECEAARRNGEHIFMSLYSLWDYMESWHANPDSPISTYFEFGEICDEYN